MWTSSIETINKLLAIILCINSILFLSFIYWMNHQLRDVEATAEITNPAKACLFCSCFSLGHWSVFNIMYNRIIDLSHLVSHYRTLCVIHRIHCCLALLSICCRWLWWSSSNFILFKECIILCLIDFGLL